MSAPSTFFQAPKHVSSLPLQTLGAREAAAPLTAAASSHHTRTTSLQRPASSKPKTTLPRKSYGNRLPSLQTGKKWTGFNWKKKDFELWRNLIILQTFVLFYANEIPTATWPIYRVTNCDEQTGRDIIILICHSGKMNNMNITYSWNLWRNIFY